VAEQILKSRTFEKDGFRYIVSHILEDDNPKSHGLGDASNYAGLSVAEQKQYLAQDAERIAAYNRGDWHYIGVAVDIRKNTTSNWADGGAIVGRASIWGIESDSEPSYITQTEEETIAEAEAEIARLRAALCGHALKRATRRVD
jgi:hypothetical protein